MNRCAAVAGRAPPPARRSRRQVLTVALAVAPGTSSDGTQPTPTTLSRWVVRPAGPAALVTPYVGANRFAAAALVSERTTAASWSPDTTTTCFTSLPDRLATALVRSSTFPQATVAVAATVYFRCFAVGVSVRATVRFSTGQSSTTTPSAPSAGSRAR